MSVVIQHTIECDVEGCDNSHSEDFKWSPGDAAPVPCPPVSWLRIGGAHVCGRHAVEIRTEPWPNDHRKIWRYSPDGWQVAR